MKNIQENITSKMNQLMGKEKKKKKMKKIFVDLERKRKYPTTCRN